MKEYIVIEVKNAEEREEQLNRFSDVTLTLTRDLMGFVSDRFNVDFVAREAATQIPSVGVDAIVKQEEGETPGFINGIPIEMIEDVKPHIAVVTIPDDPPSIPFVVKNEEDDNGYTNAPHTAENLTMDLVVVENQGGKVDPSVVGQSVVNQKDAHQKDDSKSVKKSGKVASDDDKRKKTHSVEKTKQAGISTEKVDKHKDAHRKEPRTKTGQSSDKVADKYRDTRRKDSSKSVNSAEKRAIDDSDKKKKTKTNVKTSDKQGTTTKAGNSIEKDARRKESSKETRKAVRDDSNVEKRARNVENVTTQSTQKSGTSVDKRIQTQKEVGQKPKQRSEVVKKQGVNDVRNVKAPVSVVKTKIVEAGVDILGKILDGSDWNDALKLQSLIRKQQEPIKPDTKGVAKEVEVKRPKLIDGSSEMDTSVVVKPLVVEKSIESSGLDTTSVAVKSVGMDVAVNMLKTRSDLKMPRLECVDSNKDSDPSPAVQSNENSVQLNTNVPENQTIVENSTLPNEINPVNNIALIVKQEEPDEHTNEVPFYTIDEDVKPNIAVDQISNDPPFVPCAVKIEENESDGQDSETAIESFSNKLGSEEIRESVGDGVTEKLTEKRVENVTTLSTQMSGISADQIIKTQKEVGQKPEERSEVVEKQGVDDVGKDRTTVSVVKIKNIDDNDCLKRKDAPKPESSMKKSLEPTKPVSNEVVKEIETEAGIGIARKILKSTHWDSAPKPESLMKRPLEATEPVSKEVEVRSSKLMKGSSQKPLLIDAVVEKSIELIELDTTSEDEIDTSEWAKKHEGSTESEDEMKTDKWHDEYDWEGRRLLQCKKCNTYIDNKLSNVKRHLIVHIPQEYECPVRRCTFKSNCDMVMHLHYSRIHANVTCALKEKEETEEDRRKYNAVMEECFPEFGTKSFRNTCQLCHETMVKNSPTERRIHSIFHLEYMLYKCDETECEYESLHPGDMEEHREMEHGKIFGVKDTKIELTEKQEVKIASTMKKCFPK